MFSNYDELMKQKQNLLFMVFLFFSHFARAGIFIEPYLGLGSGKINTGDEVVLTGDLSGYLIGLRSGYSFGQTLYLGLDYNRVGPSNFKITYPYTNYVDQTLVMTFFSYGLSLSVNLGPIRLFASQSPSASLIEYTKDFHYNGQMQSLGMGWVVSKDLVFQIQTQIYNLKANDSSQTHITCASWAISCDDRANMQMTFFSVSVPLE
jgi:hypothetical protein